MMYSEFCQISGQEVSYEAYKEKFEPMYNALNINKHEFINFMMPTIKNVAKKEKMARESEERKNQKLVFVSDGSRTPNGCYYIGSFFKLVGSDIKTGKALVRELTDDEFKKEVYPYYSADCHGFYDIKSDKIQIVNK